MALQDKKLLYRIPGRPRAVPDGSTMPLQEAPESTLQVQVGLERRKVPVLKLPYTGMLNGQNCHIYIFQLTNASLKFENNYL